MANKENVDDNELQSMMTNKQQQETHAYRSRSPRQLNTQTRMSIIFKLVGRKTVWISLLLLLIISGTVVIVVHRHPTPQNDISIQEDQTNNDSLARKVSSSLLGINTPENNEGSDRLVPKLRSHVEHKKSRSPARNGHMNIYIRKDRSRDHQGDYKRFRFPVVQFDRRQNPLRGPLLSFMPGVSIFADRLTKQTIIFTQLGVYVLPPIVTFIGQLFSIAELIASGYASLVSSGAPLTGITDMSRFFLPTPVIGPGIPVFNPLVGRFTGGIRTPFRSFSTSKYHAIRPIVDDSSETDENDDNDYLKGNDNRNYKYEGSPQKYNKKKPSRTSKPKTKTTDFTTTSMTTLYEHWGPRPFLTRCQSNTDFDHIQTNAVRQNADAEVSKSKKTLNRFKIPRTYENHEKHQWAKDTYIMELKPTAVKKDYQKMIQESLKKEFANKKPKTKIYREISSSLYQAIVCSIEGSDSIDVFQEHDDIVSIRPVTWIPAPKPVNVVGVKEETNMSQSATLAPHEISGVMEVHRKLKNFGSGVRVAVIDTGIYYKHPALGGCFGKGCKVAFGYDLVGDAYGTDFIYDRQPDDDPLDDCSSVSHGTHIAGIIAGNTTGIDDPFFIPDLNFLGVAPQVTLGAYRVFGCYDDAGVFDDVIIEAINRAFEDKADIITLSLGGLRAYFMSAYSSLIERLNNAGVFVTISAGNSGEGGVHTTQSPAITPGTISVGSVINPIMLGRKIIAPDNREIGYLPGVTFGGWKTTVQSRIIVNDPTGGKDDGCNGVSKPVKGEVVLFAFHVGDVCGSAVRCNNAAHVGAAGCLLYGVELIAGGSNISSGSISLEDGISIVETVKADSSAVYTFTNEFLTVKIPRGKTMSTFSSFGLTGDLFFYPKLSAVGENVYSTVSPHVAKQANSVNSYMVLSGTSMSCPYVAGVLALLLSSIGNPPRHTVNGKSKHGICRPKNNLVISLLQSNAEILNMYQSSLLTSASHQGAGLVNAFKTITTKSFFYPSELSLNDSVRMKTMYKVRFFNIGNRKGMYTITHHGAALVTSITSVSDQLLNTPIYSGDFATVYIEPSKFELEPDSSIEIKIRFESPPNVDSSRLPLYSGFISANNERTGHSVHLQYAGVVGDYQNANIFVRSNPSGVVTGIQDINGNYVADREITTLNATQRTIIVIVIAWPTRLLRVEAIRVHDNGQTDENLGLIFNRGVFYFTDLPRNIDAPSENFQSYRFIWQGGIFQPDNPENTTPSTKLPTGHYKLRFSALKHYGNPNDNNYFETHDTPEFNLVF